MTDTKLKKYFSKFTLENSDVKDNKTVINYLETGGIQVPRYINEFWTSK